jgi:hypothetical protein
LSGNGFEMSDVENRIRAQFPGLYVTFVSILVGLLFEDLVSIARDRHDLWPLQDASAKTWVQVVTAGAAAFLAWIGYSHIAIARRAIPSIFDSLNVLAMPIFLFVLNSAIGGRDHVWFYMLAGYGALGGLVHFVSVRQASHDPQLHAIISMNHPRGPLILPFVSVPLLVFFGTASQADVLSPTAKTAAMALPIAGQIAYAVLYVSRWRAFVGKGER